MRRLFLVYILLLLISPLAFSNQDKNCEDQLTEKKTEFQELMELRQALEERIYPDTDPFSGRTTFDESHKLFEYFSFTEDKKNRSILGEVRNFINNSAKADMAQVSAMAKRVLTVGHAQVKKSSTSKSDLHRVSLATELLATHILSKFPEQIPPTEPQEGESDKEEKKKEEKKKEEAQPGEQQDPEYPEDQEQNYDPHTKDSDGKQKAETTFVAAEVDVPQLDFFRNIVFNDVLRNGNKRMRVVGLPGQRHLEPRSYTNTKTTLTLHLENKTQVPILIPVGFEPLQLPPSSPGKISITAGGQYILKTSRPLDEIKINLAKREEELGPLQIEFLKKPLGIRKDEWPLEMQAELMPLLKGDAYDQVRKVEAFIRSKYLYSVKSRPETDPIDALKAGAFQCDMAGMIMVGFVRDVLGLPARAVGGYRANSDGKNSLVVLPTERHMQVEVYINGKWQGFDPTPVKKDRKSEDEKGKETEYTPVQKDFDDTFQPDESDDDQNGKEEKEGREEKEGNEGEEESEEGQDSKEDSKDGSAGDKAGKQEGKEQDSDGENKNAKKAKPPEKKEVDPEELKKLEEALTVGSLTLKSEEDKGRLISRARHVLIRDAINPAYDTSTGLQKILRLKADLKDEAMYKNLVRNVETALEYRQRPVAEALFALAGSVKSADITTSFKRLVQMLERLNLFANLQDGDVQFALLVQELRQIREEFSKLNSPDLIEVGQASKFYNGLPAHTRRLTEEKFKISQIGPNAETKVLTQALKSGQLKDYNLIRILYPLTDFIMDSIPTPAFKTVKTFMEDRRYVTGKDFIPLEDLSRARRALVTQPNKSIVENMRDGTAFLPVRRRTVDIPSPTGRTQPKRVTIVNYDTSGSMNGTPGDFQAGLIASFVDRALSDINPMGGHNHLLSLLGFDEKVHKVTHVKNSNDAYEIIRNFRKTLANTSGGTNIMATLRESFAVILDAQKRNNGEPLASANVILMSDGQANVDLEELKKMMAQIDRRTPVKFMFVAINGSNECLQKLAQDTLSLGAHESYYHEFNTERINELMEASTKIPQLDLERELYTDKKASALPQNIESRLTALAAKIDHAVKTWLIKNQAKEIAHWTDVASKIPFKEQEQEHTPIGTELFSYRSYALRSKALKSMQEVTMVVDDLLKNFKTLTGKEPNQLLVKEAEGLKHMIREAVVFSRGGGRN